MFDRIVAPLLVTLMSEWAIGWLFGFRKADYVLAIFAVNSITNPLLNYGVRMASRAGIAFSLPTLLVMELAGVLAEAGMYMMALSATRKGRLAAFSFSANLASFLAGLLLL